MIVLRIINTSCLERWLEHSKYSRNFKNFFLLLYSLLFNYCYIKYREGVSCRDANLKVVIICLL